MRWINKGPIGASVALAALVLGSTVVAADSGGQWPSAGADQQNTRFQANEHKLSVANVGQLEEKWVFTTGGNVSATPAVDGTTVYVPDWAGNLFAVDRRTGQEKWRASIAAASGVPGDKARATPAIAGNKVILGTQGPFGGGGKILAFDKSNGQLLWSTAVETHPAAIITQSAVVHGNRVYVGTSSLEEGLAAFVPDYPCCSFRGSMAALDLNTGAVVWKTYMTPSADFPGNAVWGSTAAIDTKRGQLYIATGNNYDVPQDVLDCVAGTDDPNEKAACLPPDNYFDAIVALDLKTGAVRWVTKALPFDAWTVDCIPFLGDGDNCPDPAGPDYDFGQGPALYTVTAKGKPRELVGAGQKSGQYWALDPTTGAVVWVTQAGPGGTAGGLQWGSAVDGKRVYTANANSNLVPWTLPGGAVTTDGVWTGLDAATGQLLWQVRPSQGGSTSGPVTTANGVVYGCSLDPLGYMYALDAATGAELWKFASGGSCLSGAAIVDGTLYWGSGYTNLGPPGTPNNKLYAFGLPG
jgi:polyvinyl alcohol dehydrogenase (cytochrome)